MTITLDAWQPILVAIIGAMAAMAVPVITAIIANRAAKRAASAATAVATKVDRLDAAAQQHTKKLAEISVAVDGERRAARRKIEQLEQELFESRNPPPAEPDGT